MNSAIEKVIRDTMKCAGMQLDVRREENGLNMTYHFIHQYVTYDPRRICEAVGEQEHPVSMKTYVTAITLHELGHAMDRKSLLNSLGLTRRVMNMKKTVSREEIIRNPNLLALMMREEESRVRSEVTAWEHALRLNRTYRLVSERDFEAVKRQSLASYERRLETQIKTLQSAAGEAHFRPLH